MINLYIENLFLSNIVADSNPGVWSDPDPGFWSEPELSVLIGFVSDCSDKILLNWSDWGFSLRVGSGFGFLLGIGSGSGS